MSDPPIQIIKFETVESGKEADVEVGVWLEEEGRERDIVTGGGAETWCCGCCGLLTGGSVGG